MTEPWPADAPGVLTLPSGRRVRGRGLRQAPALPRPEFAVYLLGSPPPPVDWPSHWVRWPDFRLPADPTAFASLLQEVWHRSATERVELACRGGTGRTGTALACLAVLDGVPAADAVGFVRAAYRRRAAETPGQRRFVARFGP